jgi:hypothetical protein
VQVLIPVFVVSVKRQVEPARGAKRPPHVRRSAPGWQVVVSCGFADLVAVASDRKLRRHDGEDYDPDAIDSGESDFITS